MCKLQKKVNRNKKNVEAEKPIGLSCFTLTGENLCYIYKPQILCYHQVCGYLVFLSSLFV